MEVLSKNLICAHIVSTPPALAGGDGTFQYFAKLGGLKNFEYEHVTQKVAPVGQH